MLLWWKGWDSAGLLATVGTTVGEQPREQPPWENNNRGEAADRKGGWEEAVHSSGGGVGLSGILRESSSLIAAVLQLLSLTRN